MVNSNQTYISLLSLIRDRYDVCFEILKIMLSFSVQTGVALSCHFGSYYGACLSRSKNAEPFFVKKFGFFLLLCHSLRKQKQLLAPGVA